MEKKTEEKLSVIADRYNVMNQLLIALESEHGEWNTGNVKKREEDGEVLGTAIFEHFEEWVDIIEGKDGTLYAVEESPGGAVGYSLPITDPEIIDIINEMRPKQKKEEKKKEKKEAKPKKNYKNATWMDAFRRVANYIHMGASRYALQVGDLDGWDECAKPIEEAYKDCPEDDIVSLQLCDEEEDREGEKWLAWDSVKDFLTKPLKGNHCNTNTYGCANIFECVALWQSYNSHGYKLEVGSPYIVWLIDVIGELGKVNIKKCDTPAKLMKELDKAGI